MMGLSHLLYEPRSSEPRATRLFIEHIVSDADMAAIERAEYEADAAADQEYPR